MLFNNSVSISVLLLLLLPVLLLHLLREIQGCHQIDFCQEIWEVAELGQEGQEGGHFVGGENYDEDVCPLAWSH